MKHVCLEKIARYLLLTVLSSPLAGCARVPEESGTEQQVGQVFLELRTSDDIYELSGTLRFDRLGLPSFVLAESLGGPQHVTMVTLPVGTYGLTLDDGWTLARSDGGASDDVSHLVTSVRIQPAPVEIIANASTRVAILFELDDGSIVVFGSGSAVVVLDVDDAELACGGCAPGLLCVEGGGELGCRAPCDPTTDPGEHCPAGTACRLFFGTVGAASALEPLHFCVGVESPPADPIEDQAATSAEDLSAVINAGFRFVGQTYTAGRAGMLYGVAISVFGTGGVPLRVALRQASNGVPSSSSLTEVVLSDASSPLNRTVAFPTAIRQEPGTEYAIVVDYPSAPPGLSIGSWNGASGLSSGDIYAGGGFVASSDGSTWAVSSQETLHFRTFILPDTVSP